MNKKLFRIIFNAARGMRMVVAETTVSTGKGSNTATTAAGAPAFAPMLLGVALTGLLSMPAAHAQIVANPMAPGGQRPTILVAPNGIPVINPTTPSAAGVSRNQYIQFDVSGRGVVVNNSRGNVQSTIGGWINGNPYLATGPARVIVNEVSSSNPSYINGPVEIAGQRAEFILANPSGIAVGGGTFINAAGVTLTTGQPQFNAFGGLDSYVVRGGTITINGTGLDVSKTDYAAILARAVQVNAAIYANDLKVVTGANTVSADRSQITPTTGTGAPPTFALDVSQLGGMFANHIFLVGTEAGLGVRNAGNIGASNGNLIVTSAGRLENTGTLEGTRVELASAGDIDNRGGTIRQTSSVGLTIAAPTLSNTNGGVIGIEPVSTPTAGTGGGTGAGTGGSAGTGGTTTSPSTPTSGTGTSSSGSTAAPAPAPFVPTSPGTITAAGSILNDGGRIYAGGPIALQTPQINNAGGTLSVATMAVTGPNFSNAGGTLNVSNSFSANVGQLDNTGGKLNAGSLNIATSGDLINTDGTLTSATDANLSVSGKVENTRGTISAAGALTANVAGATINNSGTLASNQALTLKSDSLQNTQGSIQSAQAGVQLGVTNALTNANGGSINAATDLGVQAGSLANGGSLRGGNDVTIAVGSALTNDGSITAGRNTTLTAGSVQSNNSGVLGAGIQSDGKLGSVGDLRVTASGALVADGTNLAAGNATLQGQSVDLSASQTSAANIAITATQGNVTTSKATVVTPGTLAVTANSNAAQTLVNDAGQLNAGQLQVKVSNLANTNGGEIVQTGTSATAIATSGTLNNDGGRIASNGQDLTLQGASITNASGKIEHAGGGALTLTGGNFSGTDGQITANNALVVAMSGTFNQDGSKAATSAKQITIDAGSLSNRGGQIVQTGSDATRITVVGAVDNTSGTIASNGNTNIAAGSLTSQGGTIRAAETSSLDLTVGGLLDNSNKGIIGAGGNTTIAAGSFNNNTGNVTAVGDLNATVGGAATNAGGTLAANGNTTVTAASLDNSAGATAAVNGILTVRTTGTTTNNSGTLQAGGTTTLDNRGLSNQGGKVFGNSLSIDTHGNALDNSAKGTIAATTAVDIKSGALNNDTGLAQSGAAMTIDTNGQALTNTNAAGYTSGQGGIASASTLDLKTGVLDNAAGFIGAKGAIGASTQSFSDTAGGQVIGQSTVTVNTNGATYDNSGGQTQAVGALTVNAGAVQNAGGLLRSSDTLTLNAANVNNASTSGTNQGIEGTNVAINATDLGNQTGAVRAAQNLTVTSGGTVDNSSGGLMSAGDTLKLVDPNAANPSAKTLSVVNTGGTLIAGTAAVLGSDGKVQTAAFGKLEIDAKGFSGDGTTVGVNDLRIALAQDVTNNVDVKAGGNLTYATTGKLTNNGKLLAGGTVTASGNDVENAVNAEISGTHTVINAAGTLTNRGLIDSQGSTQVNAGTLTNIGTGRIYGDAVSIAAGTLNNDAETANGVTKAGTIAARDSLDIGAGTINNREHALLFSSGDMFIGGALDSKRQATGKGGTLNNESASIESLGDMSIAMGSINNLDTHLKVATNSSTVSVPSIITMDGKSWEPFDAQGNLITWGDPSTRLVYHKAEDGTVSVIGKGWTNAVTNITVTEDSVTPGTADPARIVSGGNMRLDGHVYNRDSQIMAGGALDAPDVDNQATPGKRDTTVSAIWIGYNPNRPGKPPEDPLYIPPTTTTSTYKLTDYQPQEHLSATKGYNAGVAGYTTVGNVVGGSGGVASGGRQGAIVEVPSNVSGVIKASGASAGAATGTDGAASAGGQAVPMVVRTSTPNVTVPRASLFGLNGGNRYLIETDPRFANYRQWLSSDYLLDRLGLDPNNTLKRLGDGFYEQKLIREQVAQLTGYRYLDGFSSDEDQYAALMNAGATFAKEYGLRPGIALTPAQMAQLTSDIVWLVEQTVTLPDGSTQQVLVPQLYVRVRPGDINGNGAVLSADTLNIKGSGDLVNTGTIAGRTLLRIDADNINNLGGRISGGSVTLNAKTDLNNIGGSIDARDSLKIDAGRDINIRTTTQTNGYNTNVDRVAGLYVTNPGGTLIASAGRDVNLIGGIISNQGAGSYTSITAKNDVNLGTVTETRAMMGVSSTTSMAMASSQEFGSTISTNGTTILSAGRDVNARQATVDAGKGLLSVHADRDINIEAGEAKVLGNYSAQWSDKKTFSRTDNKLSGSFDATTSVGSKFSGGLVSIGAKNDINIIGSSISGKDGVAIVAERNLTVVEGRNTSNVSVELDQQKRGISALGAAMGFVMPSGKATTTGIEVKSDIAAPSTVTSGNGGILLQGNNGVFLQGVLVDAAKDVEILGGNVVIQAATNKQSVTGTTSSKSAWYDFGSMAILKDVGKGIKARETTATEVDTTTLTRTNINGANVSITAADTLALAGTTINTPGKVSLTADTLLMGTQTTEETTRTTSQGRDVVYQVNRDNGSTNQTTNYNQINAGSLSVTANHVQAGLGARDSIEQLSKQPGMGWVNQLANDPKLSGKIDWQRVEEVHKTWDYDKQGLTPEGAAIVTLVASYLSFGAAQGAGAAVGNSAAIGVGEGVALSGGGAFLTGTGLTISGVVGGAVTAGLTALAGQAAVALANNQGDLAGALHDLGSSANVKNLLTAIVTGGVLAGLDLNPLGLPAVGGGSQGFFTQLGQNLQASTARALVATAINGGSLEENLKNGLRTAFLDTLAAQSAFAIGQADIDGLTSNVAHVIAGCVVGAGRAGGTSGISSGSGCGAGAIGALVGHLTADLYNPDGNLAYQDQTVQISRLMAGLAGALVGGGQAAVDIASAAGANAAANNKLSGSQERKKRAELAACGDDLGCRITTSIKWDVVDKAQQGTITKLAAAKEAALLDPSKANLDTLSAALNDAAGLYQAFRNQNDTGGVRSMSNVVVAGVLALAQSCAAATDCSGYPLTPTQREVVGAAFVEFGLAAEGSIATSDLGRVAAIVEAVSSTAGITWKTASDLVGGLSTGVKQWFTGSATAAPLPPISPNIGKMIDAMGTPLASDTLASAAFRQKALDTAKAYETAGDEGLVALAKSLDAQLGNYKTINISRVTLEDGSTILVGSQSGGTVLSRDARDFLTANGIVPLAKGGVNVHAEGNSVNAIVTNIAEALPGVKIKSIVLAPSKPMCTNCESNSTIFQTTSGIPITNAPGVTFSNKASKNGTGTDRWLSYRGQ
ncbi:filamentous hemagglutinin N-terminal domain-containing protein [Variovorax guangxiensis]|uniref:Filamentous hemagglutinin N-terminal domain-containing protein n=1 Tax=Variovorax guangxiensis TaxID=1775474 RepID=A0A433MSW2_9BURK|nr:filamentous hemagglutinin N-terminal domain-containing protein [Variovorax guangxiensis]RUR70928.1 filamentous hemagglutinin N-terminal domain-containing protein [Variovorax guangxiensis]